MTPERWQQVKEILNNSLDLERSARPAYLDVACGDDPDLRREVDSLIASYDDADDVLERPLHPVDDPNALVGRTAGEFRFVREVGEGGMSRVYLAERIGAGEPRQVAIKVVKRGMDYDFVLRRFHHESRIMAALNHPNIAKLIGGGATDDGIPYFIMEYIAGQPITEYCDLHHLDIRTRLQLFRTVCSAVQYAHEQGVIHRDIKPGNILIDEARTPKLLDFGIAKVVDPQHWTHSIDVTASIMRLMTPEYASPEQVRGEFVFEPSDVYSLGVLLYELLTGHKPYAVRDRPAHELARAICEEVPHRPSTAVMRREEVSRLRSGTPVLITPEEVCTHRSTELRKLRRALAGDLDNIVLMALRKEPRRRYASVRELSDDIRLHLERRPVTARRDTFAYRTSKFIHRHPKALTAAGLALPLALAAGFATWRWIRGPASADTALLPLRVSPFTTYTGNETQPAFSPDGRRIAFVWNGEDGGNQDIYVRSLAGGPTKRLTTDPARDINPVWSPEGSRIAFLRLTRDRASLMIVAEGGGEAATVTTVWPDRIEAVGRHMDWSADGRYLAVADKSSAAEPYAIHLVPVEGGPHRRITFPAPLQIGDSGPVFSRDGQRLSFLRTSSSGVTEMWVADADGSGARQITSDHRTVRSQAWVPDGTALVFSSNRTGSYSLWTIPSVGGVPRRVPGSTEGAEPSISPNGERIAFAQEFLDSNIWRATIEPGGGLSDRRKLIASAKYDAGPSWSPDGNRIAFSSDRSGYREIWTCDATGQNALQLTHINGGLTGTPRWSPDSKWVAFDSRPEGQAEIYVVNASGGEPRRITRDLSEDVVPSWSRDGKWIYFASNRTGTWQVWKASADGSSRMQVTRGGGFAAAESEDGRFVYYALSRSAPGLYRIPVGGGAEQPVWPKLKTGYWGYWLLTSKGILYADMPDSGPAGLFLLPAAGGRPRRLADFYQRLTTGDPSMAVSPDGRYLLYSQIDQSGSDIMLGEFTQPLRSSP